MGIIEQIQEKLGSNRFMLEMNDDSMDELGILAGDQILLEVCDTANNGQIVIALIGGNESCLRKYFLREGCIELKSANSQRTRQSEFYPLESVKIQGRMIGIYRQY